MARPRKNGNGGGADARVIAGAVLQEVFAEFQRRGEALDLDMVLALATAVDKKAAELSNTPRAEEVTT